MTSNVTCIHPKSLKQVSVQSTGFSLVLQEKCTLCGKILKTSIK